MKNTFDIYIDSVKQLIPDVEVRLESGASDRQIKDFQKLIGLELPEDFISLYKTHDGEDLNNGPHILAGLRFLSIANSQYLFETYVKLDKKFLPIDTLSISTQPTSITRWIPFASDDDECIFAVDLTPAKEYGKVGQVIALKDSITGQSAYLMAECLTDFFEKMTGWLNDGNLKAEKDEDSFFITEKDGHLFNSIRNYAIVPTFDIPDKILELKDDFWIEKYGNSISTKELAQKDEVFEISQENVSCEPLAYVGNIGALNFFSSNIRDFHYLGKYPNLKVLNINNSTINDGDLSVLKGCTNLKVLYLYNQKMLNGIDLIGTLPNLVKFLFAGKLTDEVKSFLISSNKLEKLKLIGLTASDIPCIYTLKKLQVLSLVMSEEQNDILLNNFNPSKSHKSIDPFLYLTKFEYKGKLNHEFYELIELMPNLESLTLKGSLSSDLSFISKLLKLKKIEIQFDDEVRIDNLNFLLKLNDLVEFEMNAFVDNEKSLVDVFCLKKLKKFCCPINEVEIYRNNKRLIEIGIYGRDNVDISVLDKTKCKNVWVYSSDRFYMSKSFRNLYSSIIKQNFGFIHCGLY